MKTLLMVALALAMNVSAEEKTKMNEVTPAQVVTIQKQIELLKAHKGKSAFVTIQEVGGDAIVQVARLTDKGNTSWSLNIAYYPSKDKPAKALAAVGITVPPAWQEEQFEAETVAQYGVPESDLSKLPQFIHELFVKFFKRPATYKVECAIEDE
jgi:hypothetical protein